MSKGTKLKFSIHLERKDLLLNSSLTECGVDSFLNLLNSSQKIDIRQMLQDALQKAESQKD